MPGTNIAFAQEKAPCGRTVDGKHHHEEDGHGLIIDDMYFACGCRRNHHEYHDGSVRNTIIRHNGKVLADELHANV